MRRAEERHAPDARPLANARDCIIVTDTDRHHDVLERRRYAYVRLDGTGIRWWAISVSDHPLYEAAEQDGE